MNLNCEIATFGPAARTLGGGGTGPVRRKNIKHPTSDGYFRPVPGAGRALGQSAVDASHAVAVEYSRARHRGRRGVRRRLGSAQYAYDASTGKVLWQSRLPTSAQGFPITYLAGGKQYVAMPAGIGGGSWSTLIAPELAPEIRRPNSGNVMMVFALPGPAR